MNTPSHRRLAVIYIENDDIWDGLFNPEVCAVLRAYITLCEAGRAGRSGCEHLVSAGGSRVTVFGNSCIGLTRPSEGELRLVGADWDGYDDLELQSGVPRPAEPANARYAVVPLREDGSLDIEAPPGLRVSLHKLGT